MQFRSVSASEAGDYFQVLFENEADNIEAGYFMVQCQFEFPDGGGFYIESNDPRLCGHFTVKSAALSKRSFGMVMPSTKWKRIQIEFGADQVAYEELLRVLRTMFEDKLQHIEEDA